MKESTMLNFLRLFVVLIACLLAVSSCAGVRPNAITQYSTIDALLAGGYDSVANTKELLRHGDFGLGTFQSLDGEMIVLDGIVYQARADGKIYTPQNIGTPFASISFFQPESSAAILSPLTLAGLEHAADGIAPNPNVPYAFKIEGFFSEVKFRAVLAQQRPYPPLAEAARHQSVNTARNVEGTLVGYRLPPFVKGINVPGYHLHFISRDHSVGGHVLGLTIMRGVMQADPCGRLELILPEDASQSGLDLAKDRTHELNKVEQ